MPSWKEDVDVFLEPVYADDTGARELFGAAAKMASRGGRALMVTPVLTGLASDVEGRKMLLMEGLRIWAPGCESSRLSQSRSTRIAKPTSA